MAGERYGCGRCGRDFAQPGRCPACGAEPLLALQDPEQRRQFQAGRTRSRNLTWAAIILVVGLYLGFELGLEQVERMGLDLSQQPALVGGVTFAVLVGAFFLIRKRDGSG